MLEVLGAGGERGAQSLIFNAWQRVPVAARQRLSEYRERVYLSAHRDTSWCEDLEFCLKDDEWVEAIMLYRLGG